MFKKLIGTHQHQRERHYFKSSRMEQPPFTISSKAIGLIACIAERLGSVESSRLYTRYPVLRRVNRLRTIHSSVAIEANSLTLGQVTAVIEGERVIAPPEEIAEVKNAFNAYRLLGEYNPYSVDDLLKAHGLMVAGIAREPGQFRSAGVGVYSGDRLIHAGVNYQLVPQLVCQLLEWAKSTDTHPLVKATVVHFELEFIHPFTDGNGRMGRLWQTMMLASWNPLFAWVPVETIVHHQQKAYYAALAKASNSADSTVFIEFMLAAIEEALERM